MDLILQGSGGVVREPARRLAQYSDRRKLETSSWEQNKGLSVRWPWAAPGASFQGQQCTVPRLGWGRAQNPP